MQPSTQTDQSYDWSKHGAPLVEADITELGDKKLNPEEAVAREREECLKLASKYRIAGQQELEDPERSLGPRMSWTDLIRRLLKCNPGLAFKDGIPGNIAVYIRKSTFEYEDADYHFNNTADTFFKHHRYITGFPKEGLPEYSHVLLDTSFLPTKEVRSWRSILISLIRNRAITYKDAVEEFGDPTLDRRSKRWFELTRQYR